MNNRADEVRKRIAKRKRDRERMIQYVDNHRTHVVEDEEKYGFEKITSYDSNLGESGHPLFNRELFLFKVLASAVLVLIVAIVFRSGADYFQSVRSFVANSMERDFQFAAVSDWYEDRFGKPLALLPVFPAKSEKVDALEDQEYALPAAARISEQFQTNGQRITIETDKGSTVTTMSEGWVSFVGVKEDFGKTVIVQHADKSETWYGNLDTISVSIYEFVERGKEVGTPSNIEDGTKGNFYFAIKKDDGFIDPIQVIQFE